MPEIWTEPVIGRGRLTTLLWLLPLPTYPSIINIDLHKLERPKRRRDFFRTRDPNKDTISSLQMVIKVIIILIQANPYLIS